MAELKTEFINGAEAGISAIVTGTEEIFNGTIGPTDLSTQNIGLFIFVSGIFQNLPSILATVEYDGEDITSKQNLIGMPNPFTSGSPYMGVLCYYVPNVKSSANLTVTASLAMPGFGDTISVHYAFVSHCATDQLYRRCYYDLNGLKTSFNPRSTIAKITEQSQVVLGITIAETGGGWTNTFPPVTSISETDFPTGYSFAFGYTDISGGETITFSASDSMPFSLNNYQGTITPRYVPPRFPAKINII